MTTRIGSPLDSDKYHVLRELGRGGMGVVYLAEDRQLRRHVALKVLYDYLNRDQAFVERFQEEACSVSTLHHPNIVCVHGLERAGEVVAIDMEFVEGASLDQLEQVTPHMAAAIARDVLGGLATCHQIGVVHRDIKPSNILLSQSGQAKISDFGLATAYATHMEATLSGSGSSGFYMGTPRYMPVQAWEGGNPEPFWDLYAFGVVLHELLSGRPAFKGDNPIAVMRKQLTESLPRLNTICTHVSPEFSDLVNALLASGREQTSDSSATSALEHLRKTPEYHELKESDSAPTIQISSVRRIARKPIDKRARWGGPTVWSSLILLLLLGVLSILGYRLIAPSFSPDVVIAPASPGPPLVRASAPVNFFEITAINKIELGLGTWMVENDTGGQPLHITGLMPLEIWSLTVDPKAEGGRHSIHGQWAGCISEANRSWNQGILSGYLLWEPEVGRMMVHAERERDSDNMREELSLVGELKEAAYDKTAFVRAIESNITVQGLLYREALPRNLRWALEVEGLMPALSKGRVIVPYAEFPVAVDGIAQEEMWTHQFFNGEGRTGELPAQSATGEPRLSVRWSEDAVYLAARVTGNTQDPRLEIGILPALELSSALSARLFAVFDENGISDWRCLKSHKETPWDCAWEGAMKRESDQVQVELRIPFQSLNAFATVGNGKRWRMNVRVSASNPDGTRRILAEWGTADHNELEHGALLVFEKQ